MTFLEYGFPVRSLNRRFLSGARRSLPPCGGLLLLTKVFVLTKYGNEKQCRTFLEQSAIFVLEVEL